MTVTKVTCGRRSDADRKPVVSPKGERFSIPDSEETGQEIPMGAGRPPLHFVRAGRECISNSSLLDSLPVRPSYPPAEIAFLPFIPFSIRNSDVQRPFYVLLPLRDFSPTRADARQRNFGFLHCLVLGGIS